MSSSGSGDGITAERTTCEKSTMASRSESRNILSSQKERVGSLRADVGEGQRGEAIENGVSGRWTGEYRGVIYGWIW